MRFRYVTSSKLITAGNTHAACPSRVCILSITAHGWLALAFLEEEDRWEDGWVDGWTDGQM